MSLDPPKILLDRSFLAAVVDDAHPAHERCVAHYRSLLDDFEREDVLLVAVSTHLRDLEQGPDLEIAPRVAAFLHRAHRGVFAPLEPLYVGFQHRRAARQVAIGDPDDALTLVMCERHRISRIATLSEAFDGHRIERVVLAAD
jgi:predicted nucleic acid-binding protein